MEKYYDIPEENSLDSMEWLEQADNLESKTRLESIEITPTVEKQVLNKIRDVLEPGTAFHCISKAVNLISRKYEWTGSRYDTSKFNIVFNREVVLTPNNVRDYLNLESELLKKIDNIFKYGIQARTFLPPGVVKNSSEYKQKMEYIEKNGTGGYDEQPMVYFSILGRGAESLDEPDGWYSGLSFIFEPPSKEVLPFENEENMIPRSKDAQGLTFGEYRVSNNPTRNYHIMKLMAEYPDLKINDPRLKIDSDSEYLEKYNVQTWPFTKDGKTRVDPTEGFSLLSRIAPRKFLGVVIDWSKISGIQMNVLIKDIVGLDEDISEISNQELYERTVEFYKKLEERDQFAINKHLSNLRERFISQMIESCMTNPEYILPVYDLEGNLIWPKQMDHNEIVEIKNIKK